MVENISILSILYLILGISLLIIEVIVPGFGIPGISGIILIILGIVSITESIFVALSIIGIVVLSIIIISFFIIKKGGNSKKINKIVLDKKLDDEGNYLSTDNMNEYLDKEGEALTTLRPSGFIMIDDIKLDALSDGGLIKMGSKVRVVRVEGSKIFVRRV